MKPYPEKIPVLTPKLPSLEHITPYLQQIDENRWYSNFGPMVKQLEERLAQYLTHQSNYNDEIFVVSCCSCTIALGLALRALELPQGANVLIPTITYIGTAVAVREAGYNPVIADVDPHSWLLTTEIAKDAIKHCKIDAVMPVASFGAEQMSSAWDDFYNETGIPVVIDAAGAFGNQKIGKHNITAFSMHATKPFGVGEGGFVASHDEDIIQYIRERTNFGIVPDNTGLVRHGGTNGKLSEYHAAIGLAALEDWQQTAEQFINLTKLYEHYLSQYHCPVMAQIRLPDTITGLFPVLLPYGVDRAQIEKSLLAHNIATRLWYLPAVQKHPAFADCKVAGSISGTKSIENRLIGLPFHLYLTENHIEYICKCLSERIKLCSYNIDDIDSGLEVKHPALG